MDIIITQVPEMTLEQFANENELTMEVHERRVYRESADRYYAHFSRAEVKKDCILCSEYGDGNTPDDAIKNYGYKISMKLLVIDAYGPNRRELLVPRIKN